LTEKSGSSHPSATIRLQGGADAARNIAGGRFYELLVKRYTEDEIEAVLNTTTPVALNSMSTKV
jgi:hypothetical protein